MMKAAHERPGAATPTSWADLVDQCETVVPRPKATQEKLKSIETVAHLEDGTKVTCQMSKNAEGKSVKIMRYYKVQELVVSKSVARRKKWEKYGAAADDPPGPNPANTYNGEEIFVQFLQETKKDEKVEKLADPLTKLKAQGKVVQCQNCKQDHWTMKCPYKDKLYALPDHLKPEKKTVPVAPVEQEQKPDKVPKYIPPSLRNRGSQRSDDPDQRSDQPSTIRVTNLPEETEEFDIQVLFKPFGALQRIYLAKDKSTGLCRGFAFVTYYQRTNAAQAVKCVDGLGYENLILRVEWAKCSRDQISK